jgi:hypothetical protein
MVKEAQKAISGVIQISIALNKYLAAKAIYPCKADRERALFGQIKRVAMRELTRTTLASAGRLRER